MSSRATPLEILFDTQDFIAIQKPSGLATIPGRGETTSTVHPMALKRDHAQALNGNFKGLTLH